MPGFFKKIAASKARKKYIKELISEAQNNIDNGAFIHQYGINSLLRTLQYAYTHPDDPRFSIETHKPDPSTASNANIRYSLKADPEVPDEEYDSSLVFEAINAIKTGTFNFRITDRLSSILNKSFVEKMLEYIDASGEKDSDVYNRVNIDRRLYSKIISDYSYTPSKDTCLLICIALKLSADQTNDLIARCGYILSHSIKRDMVIECMIQHQEYDINTINIVLDQMHLKPLGRMPSEDF